MDYLSELWNGFVTVLQTKTSSTVFSVWLKSMQLESFNGDTVIIHDEPFRCKIINEKFIPLIEESLEEIMGFHVTAVVEPKAETAAKQEPAVPELNLEEEEQTFENFIVGDRNRFAYTAARAVVERDNKYNPLIIYGDSGLGKTHLLNAIYVEMKRKDPDAKVIYVRSEDFTNELISYLQNKRDTSAFHNKYRSVSILLVDDVQFIAGKPSTETEFFNTFDTLIRANSQIVLTSDRPPREMATLTERLRSRFESGLLADIQPPELETRIAIINSKAKSLGLEIPEPLANYIAVNVKHNIRQLEGAVKNIYAQVILHGAKPDRKTVETAIRDIVREGDPTPALIDRIIEEVCRTYGVTPEELKSRRRNAELTTPRHVAIYVIHEMTDMTNQRIADVFNMKDHTSVLYAVNKIKSDVVTNYSLKTTIHDIKANVHQNEEGHI